MVHTAVFRQSLTGVVAIFGVETEPKQRPFWRSLKKNVRAIIPKLATPEL
jgi:hypothetical protein